VDESAPHQAVGRRPTALAEEVVRMKKVGVALLLLGLAVGLILTIWWVMHTCYMVLAPVFGWPTITYWQAAAGCALAGFVGNCFKHISIRTAK
jgi:hypothetical protein